MKGRISEIFDSIQGEGLYLGERQLFVRFFGCNLDCKFCDTKLSSFNEYAPGELFKKIRSHKGEYHSISFTGGEPLLQSDFLKGLLKLTSRAGYKNYLETNGTLSGELEKVIDYIDIVAMDLKLSSSADMGKLWGFHRRFLEVASRKEVFLKTIICQSTSKEDFIEALDLIRAINKEAILVLQPNSYEKREDLEDKLERFKKMSRSKGITACVIPQIHKVIGLK